LEGILAFFRILPLEADHCVFEDPIAFFGILPSEVDHCFKKTYWPSSGF
jgi:hypothetical protein